MAEHHKRTTKRRASEKEQGRATGIDELSLLAAAVHIVDLFSVVAVLAFTTIELVPLPIPRLKNVIAAIPTVHDVRALVCLKEIIAASPVDDIIAPARIFRLYEVVAGPHVDGVVAYPSYDYVSTAEGAYLVVAVLTGQFVIFLSVPKSMPPLGQPGTSFVARDWPCSLMIRVRSHRASSGAVASGECSFCNFSSF